MHHDCARDSNAPHRFEFHLRCQRARVLFLSARNFLLTNRVIYYIVCIAEAERAVLRLASSARLSPSNGRFPSSVSALSPQKTYVRPSAGICQHRPVFRIAVKQLCFFPTLATRHCLSYRTLYSRILFPLTHFPHPYRITPDRGRACRLLLFSLFGFYRGCPKFDLGTWVLGLSLLFSSLATAFNQGALLCHR